MVVIAIIIITAVALAITAYACCYVAGGIDKIEEEILKSIEEEEEACKDEK